MQKLFGDFKNLKRALGLIKIINYNHERQRGPLCIEFSVSNRCNFNCYFCNTHSKLKKSSPKNQELSIAKVEEILNDAVSLGVKEVLFGGDGEPFLIGGMADIVRRFGKKLEIKIISNGSTLALIDRELFENISKLTISLNSIEPEMHREIHGYEGKSKLEDILFNIKRILKYPNAKSKLQINYVLAKNNLSEVERVLNLSKKWNVVFCIRPLYPAFSELEKSALSEQDIKMVLSVLKNHKTDNNEAVTASIDFGFDSLKNFGKIQKKENALLPCYFGFYWANIWSDGSYSLCSYGNKVFGNVNDNSFKQIWQNSETQRTLYKCVFMGENGKPVLKSCHDCLGPTLQSKRFHKLFSLIPNQLERARKILKSYE
jgi:AdoMet-dependent heme synthase